jgi:hypothetical protein
LKQKEKEKVIRELVLEKRVNPKNETNVDNFFSIHITTSDPNIGAIVETPESTG